MNELIPDCFGVDKPTEAEKCASCPITNLCQYTRQRFILREEVINRLSAILKKEGPGSG